MAPYLSDQRQRACGRALAVVKPSDTSEVAAIVKLCGQYRIPLVPQGGNTGLVLGSIPDQSGSAIVLSLSRLNRVRSIDSANQTITVEAGCVLAQVQEAAAQEQRLFPLSLASEGSCTIGGNLATNAGGTAVLRYGNARELCLGLEVVTAQGEIWDGLRALRKDNTGYDLRDLFIGSEGTLGIITAATLKLFPEVSSTSVALVALNDIQDAVKLLNLAQAMSQTSLTGFEVMNAHSLQAVQLAFPQYRRAFSQTYAYTVLIELSSATSQIENDALLESLISSAMEGLGVQDAILASSLAQAKELWTLRESISAAQAKLGKNIKHDISLPISAIAEFIHLTETRLQSNYPGCRIINFGHLGDGNLHYNITAPEGIEDTLFLNEQAAVNRIIHDAVHQFGGSISAEHGIGTLKKEELQRYKSEVELRMMRHIKQALDPLNLMNPGKLF